MILWIPPKTMPPTVRSNASIQVHNNELDLKKKKTKKKSKKKTTNPRVLLSCLGSVVAQRYLGIELLESVQKFAFRVCTKRWREPHNHSRNLLKLPLLKDRRKTLKLTVVYKCLNGLMVMPSNIFSSEPFKLESEITWKHISVSAICTHK